MTPRHDFLLNGYLLFLVLPIALIGWRWGALASIAGALGAMALVVAADTLGSAHLGTIGYLSRASTFTTVSVLASILHERARESTLDRQLFPRGVSASVSHIQDVLTKREREVLAMMARGATNADIAERLVISESTVKSHVKHILRKLEARNRTEAVSRYLSGSL